MRVFAIVIDVDSYLRYIHSYLKENNFLSTGIGVYDLLFFAIENFVFEESTDDYLASWTTIDFYEILGYNGLACEQIEAIIDQLEAFILHNVVQGISDYLGSYLGDLNQYRLQSTQLKDSTLYLELQEKAC